VVAAAVIPEWWTSELRDHVSSEAAALLLHLGDAAPNLDTEFVQPCMSRSGSIFFRVGDDVYAHKEAMAFRWRFSDDGSIAVDGYRLGRRVAGCTVPRGALPARGERGHPVWN
jgi:hypothetical protein